MPGTTPVVDVSNGALILNADGTYTYTPYSDFYGSDSFTYEVCTDETPVECATAVVTITVNEDKGFVIPDAFSPGDGNKNEEFYIDGVDRFERIVVEVYNRWGSLVYKNKNYQKALYYINKAINIDTENVIYWKLYAQINQRLNFLEEAERGYKKTLELGNYEVDTWITRGDILLKLGEPEAAIYNFIQAAEFYPENAELEYRLSGIYFKFSNFSKGKKHLMNALTIDFEYHNEIKDLFQKFIKNKRF